jgi:hypothetical protein
MLARTVQGVAVTLALFGAMSAAACGGGGTQEKAPAATSTEPAAAPVDAASAATVTGKVVLEGAPGRNDAIRMNADPVIDHAWVEGWSPTNLGDGEVSLQQSDVDQSALHGVLNKIRDLNLTLLSVTRKEEK